jgi:F-type H+-transporting ATPase subunit b
MNYKDLIKLVLFSSLPLFGLSAAEGMPQFNINSFPSQLFWLVLTFTILYVIVSIVLLPRIRENIRLRKNKIANDLERAENIKQEIEKMLFEYNFKITEAKENAAIMIKKSISKASNDYNSQIDIVKKQIVSKQQDFEKKLKDYRTEIEQDMLNSTASIAAQIIKKIINKEVIMEEIVTMLESNDYSERI